MFGFLKEKLKKGINKIVKTISGKEAKKEPIVEKPKEIKKEFLKVCPKCGSTNISIPPAGLDIKMTQPDYCKECGHKGTFPEMINSEVKKLQEEVEKQKFKEDKIKEREELKEKIKKKKEEIQKEIEEVHEKEIEPEEPEPIIDEKAEEVVEEPKKIKKKEPKKEGFLEKIKKAITEKEIKEKDISPLLEELKISLLESDVAFEVSEKMINDLKKNLVGEKVKRKQIEKIVNDSFKKSILEILDVGKIDIIEEGKKKKPYLILFLGFNGAGKTTSIARVAYLLQKKGLKIVFAAADCFRAASIEQLEVHGKNLGIKVIKHSYGADPAAVIFDAKKYAEAHDIDFILADSAGRSHSNVNLMEELKKIIRVNKPDLKILVVDALTGNDVIDQSNLFNDASGVDGLIMTKADVYDKGGSILSATHTLKKPILFLGVGQEYEDLKEFDSEEIVKNMLE